MENLEKRILSGGILASLSAGALNGYLDSRGYNTPAAADAILTYGPTAISGGIGGFLGFCLCARGGIGTGLAGAGACAAIGAIPAAVLTGAGYLMGYGAGTLLEG